MLQKDPLGYLGYYAGFVSRLIAFILDMVITVFTVVATTWFFSVTVTVFQISTSWAFILARFPNFAELFGRIFNPLTGSLVALIFIILYHSLFITILGQTPGKLLLGLRVLTMDGRQVRFWRALLRTVAYMLSMLVFFLGFLWVLVDDERQAWHDKIAGTYVVYAWAARPDERFLVDISNRLKRLSAGQAPSDE